MREEGGEGQAVETDRLLTDNPWLALKWFVEDTIPTDQSKSILASHNDDEDAGDQLRPEYREVEMDGEMVLCGNTDATIQMLSISDTPEAMDMMVKYQKALASLKEANGGRSTAFMREEAFQLAMAQAGVVGQMLGDAGVATQ
jgi:hypothetical protein